jgi:hypothetical protein
MLFNLHESASVRSADAVEHVHVNFVSGVYLVINVMVVTIDSDVQRLDIQGVIVQIGTDFVFEVKFVSRKILLVVMSDLVLLAFIIFPKEQLEHQVSQKQHEYNLCNAKSVASSWSSSSRPMCSMVVSSRSWFLLWLFLHVSLLVRFLLFNHDIFLGSRRRRWGSTEHIYLFIKILKNWKIGKLL